MHVSLLPRCPRLALKGLLVAVTPPTPGFGVTERHTESPELGTPASGRWAVTLQQDPHSTPHTVPTGSLKHADIRERGKQTRPHC